MAQSLAERRIQGPDIPCDDSHRSEDDREIPADFFNFKELFYFACQYIKIGSIIDTALDHENCDRNLDRRGITGNTVISDAESTGADSTKGSRQRIK